MADDNQNHVQSLSNFWEVDGYKRTVKRTEDGLVLCNELMKLMQERADIEKKYSEKIKSWGKKWNETFDRSPAYGSTREVLKGSLKEAEKLAESHIIIKDRLLNIVSANVMDWKAENYKKQLIGCKPAKTFEEEFQRAQKPWAKKFDKVHKTKKDYYAACRQLRFFTVQEVYGRPKADQPPDQTKKFQEKLDKLHKEADVSREKYVRAVEELNALNGKYMEDMSIVFGKTQEFDRKRIDFFREILHKFAETLDLSRNQIITETYQQFHKTIDELNADADLKWWSQNHGIDVPMSWPNFEEFAEESPPDRTSKIIGEGGTLPAAAVAAGAEISAQYPDSNRQSAWDPVPESNQNSLHPTNAGTWNTAAEPDHGHVNAFDDVTGDDLENANSVVDAVAAPFSNVYNGTPVRAQYDYEGQEEDELSFKAGEVFTKVRDADDQGWCTGVKEGRVGLYPDSYAQPC